MRESVPTVESFYDELAQFYHLLYEDWDRAVEKQGQALVKLLESEGVREGEPVLDAASGIGTQTIELVKCGFDVSASDISPGAVERLRSELADRGLRATVRVDDLRTLSQVHSRSLAAVIACDNSDLHP